MLKTFNRQELQNGTDHINMRRYSYTIKP